jgi:hypothetical protein
MSNTESTVYRERHHLAAFLAAAYPSVMVLNADPDEPDWPVLFVSLPTGQVSWHIAPDDMDLFEHVPVGTAEWDRHDVMEKYQRLDAMTVRMSLAGGVAGIVAAAVQPVRVTPVGYQGAAAHTFTTACDGFHPISEQCNLPATREAAGQ